MNNMYLLNNFFSREYENIINKKMMFYDYSLPEETVKEYINRVIEIPVDEIINYLCSHQTTFAITAKDIFQFSDFDDASINVCKKLLEIDNPGVTHIDAGKILQDDGVQRKDGANTKYGENHLKTASMLGLLFELTKTYFVSCIGMYYPSLPEENQKKLMTRLILRTSLVSRLIKATKNGSVNVRQFLYMISDSTYLRRKSNMKTVFNILFSSDEYDFTEIKNAIIF